MASFNDMPCGLVDSVGFQNVRFAEDVKTS